MSLTPEQYLEAIRVISQESARLREVIESYQMLMAGHRLLVRRLDVALNGLDGAAETPSLVDIVSQVEDERWKLVRQPDE